MRPISRILLSGGALAACLAPRLHAELSGTQVRPRAEAVADAGGTPTHRRELLPTGSGAGAGMWIAPTESFGFASARLYDEAGRLRYTMRANLLPAQPGPAGQDQQGGFLGLLFSVDLNGKKIKVADVSGKWIRHPNGFGEFGVDVLVETKDENQPRVTVGQIEGSLLPPGIVPLPGIEPTDRDDGSAAPGEIALVWNITG